MLLLSKIISKLLLPPGFFITILIISYIFFIKKRVRLFKVFFIGSIILLYFFSIEPVSDFLIKPLEDSYPPLDIKKKLRADYIVILGGGLVISSPEEKGRESLAPDALKRYLYGAYLSRRLKIPIIVSGGRVFEGKGVETEAETAQRMLIRLGIKKEHIYLEEKSRNTFEQAIEIRKIFSPKEIILVTSAYHMPRSIYSFKSKGFEIIPAPTDYKAKRGRYGVISYVPNVNFFRRTFIALKEYLGYLYYSVRY